MQNTFSDDDVASRLAHIFIKFYDFHHLAKEQRFKREWECGCTRLHFREYLLLFHLKYNCNPKHSCGMTASELSEVMKVKPPTINPLLFHLENSGLIIRKTDEKDHRYVRIIITGEGKQLISDIEVNFKKEFSELSDYLGEEKSRLLIDILEDVYEFYRTKRKS